MYQVRYVRQATVMKELITVRKNKCRLRTIQNVEIH